MASSCCIFVYYLVVLIVTYFFKFEWILWIDFIKETNLLYGGNLFWCVRCVFFNFNNNFCLCEPIGKCLCQVLKTGEINDLIFTKLIHGESWAKTVSSNFVIEYFIMEYSFIYFCFLIFKLISCKINHRSCYGIPWVSLQ